MFGRLAAETLAAARRGALVATGVSIEVLRRLDEMLREPDAPTEVKEPLDELRRLLGLEPLGDAREAPRDEIVATTPEEEIRERFAALLARSQSTVPPAGAHPAMTAIVDELTPDEARILRLLHDEGPQPVLAVRATPLLGRGEETVLDHVSLVAERAGCHRSEDGPTYLDNLRRLGLVRVNAEELVGHEDYDVIRSRPEVAAAETSVTEERNQRVRIDRGHVQLSHLGDLLCEICLS